MPYPFLGPMSLSAFLQRAGHACEARVAENYRAFGPWLEREQPHLIGLSVMTGHHQWAASASRFAKARCPSACVVWGGPHPTFLPESVGLAGVDVVVRGEGEHAFLELAEAVASGAPWDAVGNTWVKTAGDAIRRNPLRPLIRDLDSLPFPDRGLYRGCRALRRATVHTVMVGRGCPFHCAFCFNPRLRDLYGPQEPYVRCRSVPHVLEEIRRLVRECGLRHVHFGDDTLLAHPGWLREFLPAYGREFRLPFTCLVRADLATEPLIAELAAAGCRGVFFGVETGNEARRIGLLQKEITDEQIARTAAWLKRYGIRFRTYNMLGLPGETLEEAWETVRMNIRIRTDYPWASLFLPYPATALGEEARRRGLLPASFVSDSLAGTFHEASPLQLPRRREFENLHKFFQTAVLFPRTGPLIRRLIRLPPNAGFVLWFALVYAWVYVRSENRRWGETLRGVGWNLRYLAPSLFARKRRAEPA